MHGMTGDAELDTLGIVHQVRLLGKNVPQRLHDATTRGCGFDDQALRLGDAPAITINPLKLREYVADAKARPGVLLAPYPLLKDSVERCHHPQRMTRLCPLDLRDDPVALDSLVLRQRSQRILDAYRDANP
eukprot:6208470-Pleurochrysis_carterae.AAC.2